MIDIDGGQLGVVPVREALQIAAERGLDLVEVAANSQPVVCRIMDFGKFKYEQAKRDREARRNQKIVSIKEIKMRPRIDDHDFEVKARNVERFLRDGDKVKCTIMFRGREVVHSQLGRDVLMRLTEWLGDLAMMEQHPRLEGRNMTMFIAPKPGGGKAQIEGGSSGNAQDEDKSRGGQALSAHGRRQVPAKQGLRLTPARKEVVAAEAADQAPRPGESG